MAVLGFTARDDGYVARVDATERDVLLDVVDQVVELLGGPEVADPRPFRLGAARVDPPTDPAVRRLLPDASRFDPEVAAEFRRLTEPDLRATKVTNLLRLRAALADAAPALVVSAAAAPGIAAALTDVRLVLADRLGVRTDADAAALDGAVAVALAALEEGGDPDTEVGEAPLPDQVIFVASVYQILGMLQDDLVELMLEGLPDTGGPDPSPSAPLGSQP